MSLITNEKSKPKKGNDKSTKVPGSSSIFSIKYKLWGGFIVSTIFMIIIGMVSYQKAADGLVLNFNKATMQTVGTMNEYIDMRYEYVQAEALKFAFDSNDGSWLSAGTISADNFCSVSACITNDKFKSYVNGVNNRVEEKNTPLKDITITNIIGGCPQHPTATVRVFGGVIEMFAQGIIPTDKVEEVDAIFRAYFE